MVDPLSALQNEPAAEASSGAGVTLTEVHPFSLTQIAAWPETVAEAGAIATKLAGCAQAPGPGRLATGSQGSLLRVEPLKWWLISDGPSGDMPDIADDFGAMLDLSHSRTWINLSGGKAETLLNHFLPIDLREGAFAQGAVVSTAFHHVGVTLWKEASGYSLLIPRSFATSLWQMLTKTARQYYLAVE